MTAQLTAIELLSCVEEDLIKLYEVEIDKRLSADNRVQKRANEKRKVKVMKDFKVRLNRYKKMMNSIITQFEEADDKISREIYQEKVDKMMDFLNDLQKNNV